MLFDREMIFSKDQAPTTGTQYSTDVYDQGLAGVNINTNRELQVVCSVTTDFASGTSLAVNFVQSANSDLSSPDVLIGSGVIAEASLLKGTVLLRAAVPRTTKRYLGFQFVTVGTHTAGKVFGGIVRGTDDTAIPAFNTGY
ncbi:Bbp16 family capsid cement protein [Sphingopyxis sp. Geo48]|uniref:Bbp16 family capsid cement protein n=1 Tax=Sphingopyxis sp. Geo48 TaxID=545241 RepID=UPI0024B72804|nr:hypothetical protein [Sphingopyxis sp. Geo48]